MVGGMRRFVLEQPDGIRIASVEEFRRYCYYVAGTVGHLTSALFASVAKVKLMHVPYKGTGPGIVAVSSGEVHLLIANIASLLPQVKARRLRALAMTG